LIKKSLFDVGKVVRDRRVSLLWESKQTPFEEPLNAVSNFTPDEKFVGNFSRQQESYTVYTVFQSSAKSEERLKLANFCNLRRLA
jgi:hypothetical protein